MKRPELGAIEARILTLAVILIIIMGVSLGSLITPPALAQDTTAIQWEYAALIYSTTDAFVFTADLAANNETNKLLKDKDGEVVNIIDALNIMGADGWELVNVPAGASTYLFKRPVD